MTAVSVVVPTLNRRVLLSETIASILDQSFSDWELIIVDEASSDDTQDFLGSLRDPRIRAVRRDQVGRRPAACNDGLALARGEFVMFVDDDDLLRSDAMLRLVAALRDHPEAVGATGTCRLFAEDGDSTRVYRSTRNHTRQISRELLYGWWSNSGQNLYRMAIVREVGGFDTAFPHVHDRKLWLDVARHGPVCVLGFVAMEYRQHAGQASKSPGINEERERLWRQYIDSLPPSQRSGGRRIRLAAERAAHAEKARAAGRFTSAVGLHLAGIASAPSLVYSPLTGRPIWWGLKKSLLGMRTP